MASVPRPSQVAHGHAGGNRRPIRSLRLISFNTGFQGLENQVARVLNDRGLKAKGSLTVLLADLGKPDVLCIQETKVGGPDAIFGGGKGASSNLGPDQYFIAEGYTTFWCPNRNTEKGKKFSGTAVVVRNELVPAIVGVQEGLTGALGSEGGVWKLDGATQTATAASVSISAQSAAFATFDDKGRRLSSAIGNHAGPLFEGVEVLDSDWPPPAGPPRIAPIPWKKPQQAGVDAPALSASASASSSMASSSSSSSSAPAEGDRSPEEAITPVTEDIVGERNLLTLRELDSDGRALILDFGPSLFVLVNVYLPAATSGTREDRARKMFFSAQIAALSRRLISQHRRVIVVGDLNCAHSRLDSSDPTHWEGEHKTIDHAAGVIRTPLYDQTRNRLWTGRLTGTPTGYYTPASDRAIALANRVAGKQTGGSVAGSASALSSCPAATLAARGVSVIEPPCLAGCGFESNTCYHLNDAFRRYQPDRPFSFTCWDKYTGCRMTNAGTRIDGFLVGAGIPLVLPTHRWPARQLLEQCGRSGDSETFDAELSRFIAPGSFIFPLLAKVYERSRGQFIGVADLNANYTAPLAIASQLPSNTLAAGPNTLAFSITVQPEEGDDELSDLSVVLHRHDAGSSSATQEAASAAPGGDWNSVAFTEAGTVLLAKRDGSAAGAGTMAGGGIISAGTKAITTHYDSKAVVAAAELTSSSAASELDASKSDDSSPRSSSSSSSYKAACWWGDQSREIYMSLLPVRYYTCDDDDDDGDCAEDGSPQVVLRVKPAHTAVKMAPFSSSASSTSSSSIAAGSGSSDQGREMQAWYPVSSAARKEIERCGVTVLYSDLVMRIGGSDHCPIVLDLAVSEEAWNSGVVAPSLPENTPWLGRHKAHPASVNCHIKFSQVQQSLKALFSAAAASSASSAPKATLATSAPTSATSFSSVTKQTATNPKSNPKPKAVAGGAKQTKLSFGALPSSSLSSSVAGSSSSQGPPAKRARVEKADGEDCDTSSDSSVILIEDESSSSSHLAAEHAPRAPDLPAASQTARIPSATSIGNNTRPPGVNAFTRLAMGAAGSAKVPSCTCGLPCVSRVSKKTDTNGKGFFCCGKPDSAKGMGVDGRCDFFIWRDEWERKLTAGPAGSGNVDSGPAKFGRR